MRENGKKTLVVKGMLGMTVFVLSCGSLAACSEKEGNSAVKVEKTEDTGESSLKKETKAEPMSVAKAEPAKEEMKKAKQETADAKQEKAAEKEAEVKKAEEKAAEPTKAEEKKPETKEAKVVQASAKPQGQQQQAPAPSKPKQSQSAAPSPASETKPQTPTPQPTPKPQTPAPKPQAPQPTPQPQPEKPKVWHDPVYEDRWVVDQAAWDETVSEPIYEEVEREICSTCGADITGSSEGHIYEHALRGEATGGFYSEWQTVQTGTNTYTIHHDEVGHNEHVLVREGYWE